MRLQELEWPMMRAVASFGDDPTKVEIILPPGDPHVMLAEVTTKPAFSSSVRPCHIPV